MKETMPTESIEYITLTSDDVKQIIAQQLECRPKDVSLAICKNSFTGEQYIICTAVRRTMI